MPHSGPRNGQGRAEHEHARRQHVAPRRAERERGRDCGRGRDRAVRAGRGRGRVSAVRAGARGHDRGNRVVRVRVGRILRRGARRGRAFVWAVCAVRGGGGTRGHLWSFYYTCNKGDSAKMEAHRGIASGASVTLCMPRVPQPRKSSAVFRIDFLLQYEQPYFCHYA